MVTRIALLFSIVWLTRLVQPWLQVAGRSFSGRDVVLLLGGLFLLAKSVLEIHRALEGPVSDAGTAQVPGSVTAIIAQIVRDRMDKKAATAFIKRHAAEDVSQED